MTAAAQGHAAALREMLVEAGQGGLILEPEEVAALEAACAALQAPGEERSAFVLRLLVAGGYVTQARVAEAFDIADNCGVLPAPPPTVAAEEKPA